MKKLVSLLAILALVFAMVAFVGCDNGNGGTSDPKLPPAEVVIFEGEKTITWADFCMIPADKFEGDEPKAIEVTYKAASDMIKMNVGYDGGLGAGTLEGAEFGDPSVVLITVAEGSFTYTPTATEWAAIKASAGFGMNGPGATITKVVLK